MVVNKTNASNLAEAFGKDFANWPNKPVLVKSEPTTFGGKPMRGLRVYPDDMEGDGIAH
jgi:hypothetical protein